MRALLWLSLGAVANSPAVISLLDSAVKPLLYMGWMFSDYPDPKHPGRRKGETVTGPELLADLALLAALCALAVFSVKFFHLSIHAAPARREAH